MKTKGHVGTTLLIVGCALMFPVRASAGLVFGPDARTQFENMKAAFGDTFIDFEGLATGTKLTDQLSALGVTFASNISTVGSSPFGPFHVQLSGAFFGTDGNTIVGSPCATCVDDGRVGYEIVFAEPQRRAGLERIWNTSTLTQFFNASDELLAEHVNTVNKEFVGYFSVGNDPLVDFVARIQIDTISSSASRQVGYSDDLFFGKVVPEPTTLALLALGGLTMMRRRRASPTCPALRRDP